MAIRSTALGGLDWSSAGLTTLTAGITGSDLTIPVTNTASFKTSGILQINNERLTYTSVDSTNFYANSRGVLGTSASAHSSSDEVSERELISSQDLNDTFDALGNKINTLTAFWLNPNLYDVYDDFESYSVGAFTTNAKWEVAGSGGSGGSSLFEIASSTLSGGSGKELIARATVGGFVSTGWTSTVRALDLSPNKHTYIKFRYTTERVSASGNPSTLTLQIRIPGQSNTTISSRSTGNTSENFGNMWSLSEVLIVARGSHKYDVLVGGTKFFDDITINPLEFTLAVVTVKFGATNNFTVRSQIYIDDVRQSKGSV